MREGIVNRGCRLVLLLCLLGTQGCTQKDNSTDLRFLPAGHAVVFAAPAGKTIAVKSVGGRSSGVPPSVVFRFQRESKAAEEPVFLVLAGEVDQSVKAFAARPGVYRLVEAYLPARRGRTRWPFAESPNILEVREGEAVYVGTLHWRDTWVEITNDEAEARAVFQNRLRQFKGHSLKFTTRLVRSTEHSR